MVEYDGIAYSMNMVSLFLVTYEASCEFLDTLYAIKFIPMVNTYMVEYDEDAYQFCTRIFSTLIAAESSPQSYQHLDRMLTTIASVMRQNAKPQSYQYR